MAQESAKEARRPSIFGTDGVRDRAGEGYLRNESIDRIVSAAAFVLADRKRFPEDFPPGRGTTVVVARDTRASGADIHRVVERGFSRFGYTVADLGVLPTPGAAYIASLWPEATLGVVISASHNPAEYNGIKFLAPTGAKISPQFEAAVSDAYWSGSSTAPAASPAIPADRAREGREAYVERLVSCCRRPNRLRGKTVALDTAHGAAFEVAPEVFRRLGMHVAAMGNAPDGLNINERSGALHPEGLGTLVLRAGAAVGFCFDGDADRMIPVTRTGAILDGDFVLCLAGRSLHRDGKLPNETVVATSMSNIGLELALKDVGVRLLRTDVGDRNVYIEMVDGRHPLGGEQSGHVIFLEDAPTGDGILAALRLLDSLEGDDLDLDRECSVMKRYPQLLKNVRVSEKVPLLDLPLVSEAVDSANRRLGGRGRIVLRYSGTEPLARVMIEGPDAGTVAELVDRICDAIRKSLPAGA